MSFSIYTNKTAKQVFEELKTSENGLSKKEAALRLQQYGLNESVSHGATIVDILLRQIASPFFYLLLVAGIVSLFIGEKIDSIVIFIFIGINIVLGFIQEFKAERTIFLLKGIISQKVEVLRDGKKEIIEKKQLVPGDIVFLKTGDIVPAELRVLDVQTFLVDESVLTGESVPVLKTADALPNEEKELFRSSNILFTGTAVISGKARGVVIATGKNTALGHIITLSASKRPMGIYEKNLMYFCRLMLKIVVITVVAIFLLNLLIKGPATIVEFSLFCVALIVSILPEALPAVVILALSRGSMKMAKENVVVKRLSAIEDLGNIEILCTDKTGTLTQNKLSLEKVISANKDKAMLYGILGSDAIETILNKNSSGAVASYNTSPFDSALLARADYQTMQTLKKHQVLKEFSFDSFRMRQSVLVQDTKKGKFLITKGAPEQILKICNKFGGSFEKSEMKEDIAKEGQDGKRVLAICYKKIEASKNIEKLGHQDERAMTFLGYFVFEDPLKSTALEAISLSKKLGVVIKIITGDSKEVAGFVAKKTGLITDSNQVMLGSDLEKMHQAEFNNACEDAMVFARVSPEIKYKIIKSLQRNFEVGFMGDGINDVPSLKIANIGIAVSEATDIAKEAADIVLLKKDLRVVVNGIKDGRMIFANINKYIKCALANNFGQFYSIAAISLFINFLPMLPVQILLSNVLSDLPLLSITTDSVDIEELRKPKNYQLHNVLPLIISLGLVSTVFDFIFFVIFYKHQPAQIQSLWFIEGLLTDILLIFVIRTRHIFWKAKKPSLALIWFTIIDAIAIIILPFTKFGQDLFHFVNPGVWGVFVVLLLLIAYVGASEMVKLIYFHYFKPPKTSTL